MATKRIPTLDGSDKLPAAFLPDVTTAPIAAHVVATDPHGDRAFTTAAVSTHTAATDPHGDRSFATSAATAAQSAAIAASAQRSANLADLASASTARTNLGLGTSATKNVGTTSADVAAGDAAARKARVSDLTSPVVIAHKGGADLAPEDTMVAFKTAVGYGQKVIDVDVNLLADGVLGVMHDGTIDRTTSGTGAVSNQSSISFRNLVVDAPSWFGGSFGNTNPPLLSEVMTEFGNKVVLSVEAKSQGAATAALAAAVTRFGLKDSVILSTFFWADIPTLVATGAHVRFIMSLGTEQTPAAIAAAGCAGVDIDHSAVALTSTLVGQMHAAGLTVYGWTPRLQFDIATLMAKGADGWYSENPLYSAGAYNNYAYRLSKLPLASQTYYHGHIGEKGIFTAPDGWGIADLSNLGAKIALAGGICPIKGNPAVDTYTIDFTLVIESAADANRWMGFYVGFNSDASFNDNGTNRTGRNGYRCLINGGGYLQISKYTDHINVGTIATQATAALSYPATVTGKIIVSPTQVQIQRTDVAGTATAVDASYRGGYAYLGANGVTGRFTRVEVTA